MNVRGRTKSSPFCLVNHLSHAQVTEFNPNLLLFLIQFAFYIFFFASNQISGKLNAKRLKDRLPRRTFALIHLLPAEKYLSHIFLGFTQNGKFLISYEIDNDTKTVT